MTEPTAVLVLNPIMCDGRGLCHDAAPGLIELDEWGFPLLPGGGLRADIARADRRAAEAATHACPVLALHIER
jgi:ferredoxin